MSSCVIERNRFCCVSHAVQNTHICTVNKQEFSLHVTDFVGKPLYTELLRETLCVPCVGLDVTWWAMGGCHGDSSCIVCVYMITV